MRTKGVSVALGLWLCLALSSEARSQVVLIEEPFDTFPSGWNHFHGSATVGGGMLSLSFGCVALPSTYSREHGIRIEADVRVHWQFAGDFNFLAFHDMPSTCHSNPNGYGFGFYPIGSDNPEHIIGVAVNGDGSNAFAPTTLTAGQWHHVMAEILPDGDLVLYTDGIERLRRNDNSHTSGVLTLRTWGDVDIDNVRLTQLCQYGPADPVVVERQAGKPMVQQVSWHSCGGPGTLTIDSTGVASALVYLNGAPVTVESDFNATVRQLVVPVELLPGENELDVAVRGKPGETLTLTLEAGAN